MKRYKRFIKIFFILFILLLIAVNVSLYLLSLPKVQTYLTQRAASLITSTTGAPASVGSVDLRIRRFILNEVLIRDLNSDTLLYIRHLNIRPALGSIFRNKIDVKSWELDDAKIFLHRSENSDEFNYEAIFGKGTQSSGGENPFHIRIPKGEVNNLDFNYLDERKHAQFRIGFDRLFVRALNINPSDRFLRVDAMELDSADILVRSLFTDECKPGDNSDHSSGPQSINTGSWHVLAGSMKISGSRFRHINENNLQSKGGMNYNDLDVQDINVELTETKIICDTLRSTIVNLSAHEKCGFSIKSMSAIAKVSTDEIVCSNLNLVTDNSVIKNYYSMSYESFRDFNDYVNKVTMKGDFTNSRIALKDINYFAQNALDKIAHNTVWISGVVKGTVSNLKGKDLKFNLGKETRFTGDISFKGLPVFKETFMALQVEDMRTSVSDLRAIYPHLTYPENMNKLGRMNFNGKFTGFSTDFVADGNLSTEIGNARSDINFKIDEHKNARYSGNFATENFHLGKFVNKENLLGEITFNAAVKGSGLKINTLKAEVDGTVNSISLKQHEYKDLKVEGELKSRFFKGLLTVRDKNLDMDFEGTVDMSDTLPVFQLVSDIRKANLRELNLTKDSISIATMIKLDFTGLTPEKFSGYAGVFQTVVEKDSEIFFLDTLELRAQTISATEKTLTLHSDVAEANITGNFNRYEEIPKALLDVVEYYFNSADTMRSFLAEQTFTFHVKLNDTENLTKLIVPQLKNIAGGTISGAFDNRNNHIQLHASIPGVTYSNFDFQNILVNAATEENVMNFTSSIDSVLLDDSLLVEKISLTSRITSTGMKFSLLAQDDSRPNRLNLNGLLQTDFQSARLQFLPSSLHVNNDLWTIADSNSIFYDAKVLLVENLKLNNRTNPGELEVKSFIDAASNNHLSVFFRAFELDNISKTFLSRSKLKLDGTINGNATVMNVLTEPMLTASLKVDTFRLNRQPLGAVSVNSNYLPGDEKVAIDIGMEGAYNDVKMSGYYNITDKKNYLDFTCDIKNLHLPHIEPFIEKEVSKVQGDAYGRLTFKGSFEKPIVRGALIAKNVAARVNYLNATFSFDNEKIIFAKGIIDLDEMTLKDEEGNTAKSNGIISYHNFEKLLFDIEIETDKFLLMNSNHFANQPFYGRLLADATVLIKGSTQNVEFGITGETLHGTSVYIDVNSGKDVDQYTFYRFVNNAKQKEAGKKYITRTQGITLDCDVTATSDAQVNLILDYEDGDIIKAMGQGNLRVQLDKTGELSIVGEYKIVDGNYLFSMENIISKRFSMVRGSSIVWSGNPTNAQLDISALYKLRASPYDLIEDIVTTDQQKLQAQDRVQVLLYLYITGSLMQPDIKFDIEVPDAQASIRTALETRFQALKLDPNEFNKQVVGLLVLNRFLPQSNSTSEQTNIANDVNNSVSEFLSNQLSIYLSDWISEFITDVQLDINYRSYQSEVTGSQPEEVDFQNRQELQLALNKTFYNDRISIDVGGNFDFGAESQNTQGSASNIAGDFEIEYSITPDGRIKVKAFRKGEYDIFENRNKNKTGIGISYEKEFDSFEDFFLNLRQKKEEKKLKKAAQQAM